MAGSHDALHFNHVPAKLQYIIPVGGEMIIPRYQVGNRALVTLNGLRWPVYLTFCIVVR